jgi:hypothetical protein
MMIQVAFAKIYPKGLLKVKLNMIRLAFVLFAAR